MAFNMTTQECQELEQRILNLLDENIILIATESGYWFAKGKYYPDGKLPAEKKIKTGVLRLIELNKKVITEMWSLERAESSYFDGNLDTNKAFIQSMLKENKHGAYFYIKNTRGNIADTKKLTHASIKTLENYTIEDKGYTDGNWGVVLNKNGDINKIGVSSGYDCHYTFWVENLKIQDFTKIRNYAFETVNILERHMQDLEKKIQKTVLQIQQLERFFGAKSRSLFGENSPKIYLQGEESFLHIAMDVNVHNNIECTRGVEILSNQGMADDVITNMCAIRQRLIELKDNMDEIGDIYVYFYHAA